MTEVIEKEERTSGQRRLPGPHARTSRQDSLLVPGPKTSTCFPADLRVRGADAPFRGMLREVCAHPNHSLLWRTDTSSALGEAVCKHSTKRAFPHPPRFRPGCWPSAPSLEKSWGRLSAPQPRAPEGTSCTRSGPPEKRPRAGRGRLTPLAVLNSPSGQARQWKLVGAMQMGALISCPRTVVRVSTCDTSLRYQGRRRILRGRQRFSAGGTALQRCRGLWVAGAAGSSCGPLGHPWRVGRGQHGQQEAPPPRKRLPGAPSCAPVVPPAPPPTCPGGPGYPSSPAQTLSPRLL